jgi:PAS domain S-box-containing protein
MIKTNCLSIFQIPATLEVAISQNIVAILCCMSFLPVILIWLLFKSRNRHKKIARELARCEKRNNTLQENAGDAVVILSETGKLLYASPSVYQVVGYTVEELLKLDLMALAHPEDVNALQLVMLQVMANPGMPVKGHTGRMLHKDGSWHWYEAVVTNMLQDPEIGGIVDNFRDVTDRVIAEEKMINANRLYAFISAVNQTLVHAENEQSVFKEACRIAIEYGKFKMAWIGLLDPDGKSISLAQSSGISDEDELKFKNVIISEQGPIRQVLNTGTSFIYNNVESELSLTDWKAYAASRELSSAMLLPIRKKGEIIGIFNLYASIPKFFDGQEIRLLEEAVQDISFAMDLFEKERLQRQAQDKLLHSELRLIEAQAIAHVGSWEINFATGISLWSEEACRIYGLSIQEKHQSYQDWLSFIHPEDLEFVVKTTKQAEASHSSSAFYHRVVRRNGEVRYIYSKTEFDFRDGLPVGLHGIAHDITEQKLVSVEREKLLADLVKRNNDLEQFSYIISHNLRAPVVNILGISDLIRAGGLEKEDEKTLMAGLESSVSRLDEVINDLNYILQLNSKEQQNKEWVKLSELINDIRSSISSEIINGQVEFILDFSAIDEVLTLKVYLYSIFYNLIINSIKYRKPDVPPEISITSFKSEDKITIVVKDNGLGIDLPKRHDEVFGLYKRFHAHVEGKGIGLYMVKKQVESLQGSITVESEVNKGTEFRIQFDLQLPANERTFKI